MDVKGAFLNEEFKDSKVIYMKVSHGFEKFYTEDVVLKLKKCNYGLKQAAMAFWQQLLLCMKSMEMVHSTVDPCLYHQWGEDELVLIVSWIDDNLIIGSKKAVEKAKKELMESLTVKTVATLKSTWDTTLKRQRIP